MPGPRGRQAFTLGARREPLWGPLFGGQGAFVPDIKA